MTAPTRPGISRWRRAVLAVAVCIAGCTQQPMAKAKEVAMDGAPMTLWQAIEALAKQIPFTTEKVEHTLGAKLSERDNAPNNLYHLYGSEPVALADGVVVSNVDLRIKIVGPHPGFMVLNIAGACVTIEQVRSHYSALTITDTPRGHSINDVTSYTSEQPWGKVSFSFAERNPKCLSSVAFAPRRD